MQIFDYDCNESVQIQDINVVPCAYLHNYYFDSDDTLLSDKYKEYIFCSSIVWHNDVLKLREFIKKYIENGDDGKILFDIDNGRIRPSKCVARFFSTNAS